jgi:S-DNA-T family DNA segregation ATPase FtsK/SpoIIIE
MARDPYRRHVRRMRKQMRKDGSPYGVVIIGPEESLGVIIISAIARWTWRHRSALAPLWIALAAFIAAGVVHLHHSGWWAPVMAGTVAVTAIVGFPLPVLRWHPAGRKIAGILSWIWQRCGIGRAAERAYAAMVIATAGGWLAAAIANGPTAKPLPIVALIATVILAIPWWFHRRRRAKVRVERAISAWPGIAADVGLPGSRIASVVVDAWGWTARLSLKRGTTVAHAIARIPEIESGLELRPGSVRVSPDGKHANRLVMRVVESEPLAAVIPWPSPVITSVTRPVEIGTSCMTLLPFPQVGRATPSYISCTSLLRIRTRSRPAAERTERATDPQV